MDTARITRKPAGPASPPSLFTPLDPELLTVRAGLMDFVHRQLEPPDLQDCAPQGTEVTDTDSTRASTTAAAANVPAPPSSSAAPCP
ncbi:hypothetical protein ACIQXA_32695 [Streptomyces massasporeus]|uniref:hypothetical protein n=1 Tax=Streptomyces massasporeus TaxID=67324 RepID=UPI0037F2DFE4